MLLAQIVRYMDTGKNENHNRNNYVISMFLLDFSKESTHHKYIKAE